MSPSELHYDALFAAVADAVLVADAEGRYVAANEAAEELLGYARDELLCMRVADVVDREVAWTEAEYARYRAEGVWRGELRLRRKDGSTVAVEARATVSPLPEGPLFLSVVRDVTDRERAEAQLRERDDLLRAITDNASLGLVVTDAGQHCVFMNPAAERILGYSIAEAFGQPLHDLVHHTRPDGTPCPRSECSFDGALLKGNRTQGEVVFVRRDGSCYPVAFTASPILRDGVPIRTVVELEDLTLRRQSEQALRESEARFRTMADHTPVIIWATDATGGIEFVNRAYQDFFGITEREVRGPHWRALVHPDDADSYVDAFLAAQRERRSFHAEARVRRADGDWRWVESFGQPRVSEDGKPLGIVGSSLDVTERKRAERATREGEARARFLADLREALDREHDPAALFRLAAHRLAGFLALDDARFGDVNVTGDRVVLHEGVRRGTRADREEVALSRLFAPATRRRLAAGRAVVIADVRSDPLTADRALQFEEFGTRACLGMPLLDGGRWVGVLVLGHGAPRSWLPEEVDLVRTVAERAWLAAGNARLLRQLDRRRREFETLVQHSPDAVARLDGDLRYRYVNPAMEAALGIPAGACIGRTNAELGVLAEEAERWDQESREALATGKERYFEFAVRTPAGRRHFRTRLVPEAADGRTAETLLAVTYDITDRVRAEAERERLLESVAHDINNPLAALKLQAQLLSRQVARRGVPDAASLGERVQGFEALATRMSELVDELRDHARLAAGAPLELRPEPTDLAEVVRAAVEEVRTGRGPHAVGLEVEANGLIGEWDPRRPRRVVANLLDNAVKYSPGGGDVRVRLTAADGAAVLAVRDSGIGIPAADLPHVFGFQRRAGNVGSIAGSGIGLAGAKWIVEQHGGTIDVASEEGRGSTFTVRLPLGSPGPHPAKPGGPASGR